MEEAMPGYSIAFYRFCDIAMLMAYSWRAFVLRVRLPEGG